MPDPLVVYWNDIPSPYVVERYNTITRRGNVTLEAWFDYVRGRRSWDVDTTAWEFASRYVQWDGSERYEHRLPIAEMRATHPDLLVATYGSGAHLAGIVAAQRYSRRIALRVLPTYDTWVQRSAAKELAKSFLFKTVDSVKVPGRGGSDVATKYGVPRSRIFNVSQSIDVEHYASATLIGEKARQDQRDALGLQGCTFLYVGRLWRGKGLDTLFDAYEAVASGVPGVSLLMVGDGPDEAAYRERASSLPNVRFAGFVQPRDLPTSIYGLADVFVFPTLGDPHGLVVEEAMAARLPVICSESAGDIGDRLPDGEAGFIVPPQDADVLAARMTMLASDASLRRQMGGIAQDLARLRSHEAYASDFEHFVEGTLLLPKRNSAARIVARGLGQGISISQFNQQPMDRVRP